MGLSLSFQDSFFRCALSSSFNKSFLLIASPSFSLELVRFRCGSFPVVPSLFFSLRRCPPLLKVIPLNCFSFLFVGTRAFSLWVFPCRSKTLFFVAALSASFNKSFLLIASAFSFQLVRFRCGSFPVVPSLFFFFVAALSSSFNKSFLLIASPSFFCLNSCVFVVGLSLSFQVSYFFRCNVVLLF